MARWRRTRWYYLERDLASPGVYLTLTSATGSSRVSVVATKPLVVHT